MFKHILGMVIDILGFVHQKQSSGQEQKLGRHFAVRNVIGRNRTSK